MDDLIRHAAHAARHEVEATIDVDAAFAELTARVDDHDTVVPRLMAPADRVRRRPMVLAAAAAVVAVVAGLGYVLTRPDAIESVDTTPITTPNTTPNTIPSSTIPSSTIPPSSAPTTSAPSTGPTTTTPVAAGTPTISVTSAGLPPEGVLDRSVMQLDAAPGTAALPAMVGDLGIAVVNTTEVTILAWDGTRRVVALDAPLASPLYGPGDVLYGFDALRGEMVAVALSGPKQGDVVASAPTPDEPAIPLPDPFLPNSFVHGQDGIVDVALTSGGPVWIGYVDVNGEPIAWTGAPLAPVALDLHPGAGTDDDDGALLRLGDRSVQLDITRHPDYPGPFDRTLVARGVGGGAVYPTVMGPSTGANDQPSSLGGVIASLPVDGQPFWSSIPDGWAYASSGPWGVLVVQDLPDQATVIWSLLDLRRLIDPRTFDGTDTGVPVACAGEQGTCIGVAIAPDGAAAIYDRNNGELTLRRDPAITTVLPAELRAASIIAVGPDDTVYLTVSPPDAVDPVGDIVAVAMAGDAPGTVVGRWDGAADLSGDSDLVPTPAGLAWVGCCGSDTLRPAPDARIEAPWLDRRGDPVVADLPIVTWTTDTKIVTVGKRTWTLTGLAADAGFRGMPPIVATADGGFLASFTPVSAAYTSLVRGWPDGTVSQVDVTFFPTALTPVGEVWFLGQSTFTATDPFAA